VDDFETGLANLVPPSDSEEGAVSDSEEGAASDKDKEEEEEGNDVETPHVELPQMRAPPVQPLSRTNMSLSLRGEHSSPGFRRCAHAWQLHSPLPSHMSHVQNDAGALALTGPPRPRKPASLPRADTRS
jgi:hypothetical protein